MTDRVPENPISATRSVTSLSSVIYVLVMIYVSIVKKNKKLFFPYFFVIYNNMNLW